MLYSSDKPYITAFGYRICDTRISEGLKDKRGISFPRQHVTPRCLSHKRRSVYHSCVFPPHISILIYYFPRFFLNRYLPFSLFMYSSFIGLIFPLSYSSFFFLSLFLPIVILIQFYFFHYCLFSSSFISLPRFCCLLTFFLLLFIFFHISFYVLFLY
jgi:hypothetical protein